MTSAELLREINAHARLPLSAPQRQRHQARLLDVCRDHLQKQQDGISRIIDLVDGHALQRGGQPPDSNQFHYHHGVIDGLQSALDTLTNPDP